MAWWQPSGTSIPYKLRQKVKSLYAAGFSNEQVAEYIWGPRWDDACVDRSGWVLSDEFIQKVDIWVTSGNDPSHIARETIAYLAGAGK